MKRFEGNVRERNVCRYKYLAEKERQLYDQLVNVNQEMTNLATAILDSNCEPMDETMKTFYKTDYGKRGRKQCGQNSSSESILK